MSLTPRHWIQKLAILAIGLVLSLWPVAGGLVEAARSPAPGEYAGPLVLLFLGTALPAWIFLVLVAAGLLAPSRPVKLGCAVLSAVLAAGMLVLLVLYTVVQGAAAVRLGYLPSSPGIPLLLLLAGWLGWIAALAWVERRPAEAG